jgi:uncharacterized protein involved in outer membrane biogenesis
VSVDRRTKIVVALLATPVVLFLVLLLFLKFYFTSERLKAIILPKIQAATNREVTVEKVSLSIFPSFGLKLEDVRVPNREGRSLAPLVQLDEFFVEVKLLPLLGNRLEVDRVFFDRPRIFIESDSVGRKPEKREKEEEKVRVELSKGGALLLRNFEIRNGEFVYVDRVENRAVRINGLNLRLRVETIAEVNEVRTGSETTIAELSYGAIENPIIRRANFRVKEKSTFRAEEKKIILEKGMLEIEDVKLQMSGSLDASNETPLLDFAIRSESTDLRQLVTLLPQGVLPQADQADIEGRAEIAGRVKGKVGMSDSLELSLEATLSDGKIHYTNLPKAITDLNFKATLVSTGTGGKLEISPFSAKLGDNVVRMKLLLEDLKDPLIEGSIDGTVNLSGVKDFYPLAAGKELSGLVRIKVFLKGKTSAPLAMTGNGSLELRNVYLGLGETPIRNLTGVVTLNNQRVEGKSVKMNYGPSDLSISFLLQNYLAAIFPSGIERQKANSMKPALTMSVTSTYFESTPSREPIVLPPFDTQAEVGISKFVYKGTQPFECTDLRGDVSVSEQVLRVKNLSLKVFGGNMTAAGTIDLRDQKRPQFNLTVDAKGVESNVLLRRFTSFGEHLFGALSATAELKGALDDTLALSPKTLSGQGSLHFAEGRLTGYPVMERLSSFLEVPELREVVFNSWSNAFKISDGRISIPELKIAAKNHDLLLTGWQGLDGAVDYRLAIKLSEALSNRFAGTTVAGQVTNLLKEKDGRVTLFIQVGGTVGDPKFRWDTKAAEERLRERVKAEIEEKKEQARERAKDELQKKLDEEKKKLQEGLKRLFKKP